MFRSLILPVGAAIVFFGLAPLMVPAQTAPAQVTPTPTAAPVATVPPATPGMAAAPAMPRPAPPAVGNRGTYRSGR